MHSWVIISRLWITLHIVIVKSYRYKRYDLNNIVLFSLISIKILMKQVLASLQLPAKYPVLPASLIGQIKTNLDRRVGGGWGGGATIYVVVISYDYYRA